MKSQILEMAAYVLVLSAMSASAVIRYVNVNSAGPQSPYTNWTTAATSIQDAVEATVAGDQILVTNGAALVGFTLTNGATRSSGDDLREQSGGGVWCESASAVVSNCTLTGNSARNGGGAFQSALNNCIIYYNRADNGEDNCSGSVLSYSCTTPLPRNGPGNITNSPLFVDYVVGNLRLQSNSPCINAGSGGFAPADTDLEGNSRLAGGTVDIGAYEFQSPQSLISYAWLQQYGLPTDGSADVTDADADGLNNWQEWRTRTDPTNALSALRLLSPSLGAPGVRVSWQSVSGLNYFLERATHLGAQPPFLRLATNIVGKPGTTTFTDTKTVGAGPFFYRVGVGE